MRTTSLSCSEDLVPASRELDSCFPLSSPATLRPLDAEGRVVELSGKSNVRTPFASMAVGFAALRFALAAELPLEGAAFAPPLPLALLPAAGPATPAIAASGWGAAALALSAEATWCPGSPNPGAQFASAVSIAWPRSHHTPIVLCCSLSGSNFSASSLVTSSSAFALHRTDRSRNVSTFAACKWSNKYISQSRSRMAWQNRSANRSKSEAISTELIRSVSNEYTY
mmetsp:Transcript_19015/g.47593  ORF Transcript_19015/g.47593 Transcript_19015/m.47593 type:complete len:226 (-) Transcript_19015:8880-9557(-)